MANSTTTTPFKEGDEVRITRLVRGYGDERALTVGTIAIIEDYVSADEAEDGEAFYWASNGGGTNNVSFPADAVELVRTSEQMYARTIPSASAVASDLGGVIGNFRAFEITESDLDGETVEFYGTTDEGLSFGFRVRVEEVWETDL